jgi:N utilization substance protein B
MARDGAPSPVGVRARNRARRLALQALYQWLLTGDTPGDLIAQFREDEDLKKADGAYFEELVIGCIREAEPIAATLAPWLDRPIAQLDPVERAALSIGAYELAHRLDVPFRVVITEGVDLAKTFGGEDSHKYVNAVLDRVARQLRAAECAARR